MAKTKIAAPDILLARLKWQGSGLDEETAARLHLTGLQPEQTRLLGPTFAQVGSLLIPYFDAHGELTKFFRVRYLEPLPGFAGSAKKPQRYAQAPAR